MAQNKTNLNACVFVGVSTRGGTRVISLANRGVRHNNSVVIYKDATVYESKKNLEDALYKLSRQATQGCPFPGVYAIPEESIPLLTKMIDNAEAAFDAGMKEIEDNYDALKKANWAEVESAISKMGKTEQAEVTKMFNSHYPDVNEIKRTRKMHVTILTSPFGMPSNIDLLSERIADTAQELYKKAVFAELVPVYSALATYYTKLSNGQDVGMKSQNHFRDKVVPELFETNTIRRDGFTDNVVQAVKYNLDNIFEDPMLCYNILLNIYEEAKQNGMEDELPDLAALEVQKLKGVTTPTYLLTLEMLEEDVPNRTPIEDMMGRVDVSALEVVE